MCLEKTDKGNIKDAVSNVRKAKSLVGKWLERSPVAGKNDTVNKFLGEILIERDTVVFADVAVGHGRDSAKVLKQSFTISTTTSGSWQRIHKNLWEGLQVQLKVRMQEVGEVQENSNIDLDDARHKWADISRLLRDDEVKDVVGKLKRA